MQEIETIETNGIHPSDLILFSGNNKSYKEIENRIIDLFANGEKAIKFSVFSESNGKILVSYKCVPLKNPVKTLDDCEFKEIEL